MKSFVIKRDEKDPRWYGVFKSWFNEKYNKDWELNYWDYYGAIEERAIGIEDVEDIRIITLDEWEAEFMQPQLAGREYDERLLNGWLSFDDNHYNATIEGFLNQRYPNPRIDEIKAQIEKLSNELKELEG